ncbi:hypothetical protein SLL00_04975 [Metabacillus indicus]|nr:hypothetical protein [Metabacillus indicus]MDX8289130.1 hypothetical protein [Metabacillus indicus]
MNFKHYWPKEKANFEKEFVLADENEMKTENDCKYLDDNIEGKCHNS